MQAKWAVRRVLVASCALALGHRSVAPAFEVQPLMNLNAPADTRAEQAVVGNTLFFAGSGATGGRELFKTDGTPQGTLRVRDINPGSPSSSPASLVNLNGTLLFAATQQGTGRELWKSDGTAAGTVMVKNIVPDGVSTSFGSNPEQLTISGGQAYFAVFDNSGTLNYIGLWRTDGTEAGTVRVFNGGPGSLTDVNGTLFYSHDRRSLWKTIGNPMAPDGSYGSGTVLVKDVWQSPLSHSTAVTNVTNINGTVYFLGNDGSNGSEPWISDGTTAGTFMLKDIAPGNQGGTPIGSSPTGFTQINDLVYFGASPGLFQSRQIWQTDGTAAGTQLFMNIEGNVFHEWNGKWYFAGREPLGAFELWVTDGTVDGTMQLKEINLGPGSSTPRNFLAIDNLLFFTADDGVHGRELWMTDGTAAGTQLVVDINLSGSSNPTGLVHLNDDLLFSAYDGSDMVLYRLSIPEPAAAMMLLPLLGLTLRRRR